MFGRKKTGTQITRPKGSVGKRAYAIGDVHGCLDHLQRLLALVEVDNATRPRKETVLVFLGDLIDRGPDSKGVIDFLMSSPPKFASSYFLMGNHEDTLVRGLNGERHLLVPWLSHGGLACAESYGLDPGALHGQSDEIVEHYLLSAIPETHLKFMAGFLESIRFGDYLFVHAGVRPNVPIEAQSARDMRWIRREFLESEENFGAVIVHGHSINDSVVVRPNRIGIDTGAYRTGVLTAVRLEDETQDFIATEASPGMSSVESEDLAVFTEPSHK